MSHCFVLGAHETTQTPFILVRIQPVTFAKIFFGSLSVSKVIVLSI